MSSCSTGKRSYSSIELAEEALIDARIRYEFKDKNGPVSVYQCDDCGQYHLTSKGPMNEKLAKAISDGKIKLEKEASDWLSKMGKHRR